MVYSIHIPKTMGTSFSKTLCDNIKNAVIITECPSCGVNYIIKNGLKEVTEAGQDAIKTKKCNSCITLDKVHSNIKSNHYSVIHGHPLYKEINVLKNTQVITWLRNPIQRVISQYFYEIRESRKHIDVYEFVSKHANIFQRFLSGVPKIDFIGIVENKDVDLPIILSLCGVSKFEFESLNTNPTKGINESYKYDLNLYKHIIANNKEDIELYNTVCSNKGRNDLIINL